MDIPTSIIKFGPGGYTIMVRIPSELVKHLNLKERMENGLKVNALDSGGDILLRFSEKR